MGSDTFSLPVLQSLLHHGHRLAEPVAVVGVVTRPDRPAGRGRRLAAGPVKTLALEAGIAVLQPERLRAQQSLEAVRSLSPELFVVASYGQIVPSELLEVPRFGSLNLHPSLLPRFRGPSPVESTLLEGDGITGTTLMLMTAAMDAGPVLDQEQTVIEQGETSGDLQSRLAQLSGNLLVRDLPRWIAGEIEPRPQNDEEATYTRRIAKQDGRIDWTLPAEVLVRRVRAFNPWPTAYTAWEGSMVRILAARSEDGTAPPGKVVDSGPGRVLVGTGDGLLAVRQLQIAGGRPLNADAFLRGHRTFLGAELGR